MLLKLISTTTEMATSTLKTSLQKSEFRALLNFIAFIRRQMERLSLLWRLIFLGHFFKPFWLSFFVCTFLLYGHPLSTDTSLLRTVCFVPWERKALIWTLSMTPSGSILKCFFSRHQPQGPEEMCLSLEHQNSSKTSEKMGYFDRVTVSLHIL